MRLGEWADEDVRKYLGLAYSEALRSPDPSTQNGAVIYHPDIDWISVGCNRFPEGVSESPERLERPLKYQMVEHAERCSIYRAAALGRRTQGATMFVCWAACADCARGIIESGITTVIAHKAMYDATPDHWRASVKVGLDMLQEAGVIYTLWEGKIGADPIRFNGEEFHP